MHRINRFIPSSYFDNTSIFLTGLFIVLAAFHVGEYFGIKFVENACYPVIPAQIEQVQIPKSLPVTPQRWRSKHIKHARVVRSMKHKRQLPIKGLIPDLNISSLYSEEVPSIVKLNSTKFTSKLPSHLSPTFYNLELYTDLENLEYNGTVTIQLNVKERSTNITLHSDGLNITYVQLEDKELHKYYYYFDKMNQFLIIRVPISFEMRKKDVVNLVIKFKRKIGKRRVGFYKTSIRKNGDTKSMAVTKFFPTHARQAFPCFDEPHMKAKFQVHVSTPRLSNLTVYSNYFTKRKFQNRNNQMQTTFDISHEAMSTYLVKYFIAESGLFSSNRMIRTTHPVHVHSRRFHTQYLFWAGNVTSYVFSKYEKYFQRYNLNTHIDIIAIPNMAYDVHWGLLCFKEISIFYHHNLHAPRQSQRVAVAVARELAHFWIGNIVAVKWWNEYWLQKGLATFMAYKILDITNWNMEEQFLIDQKYPVIDMEPIRRSREIQNVDQMVAVYEEIYYQKVATVLMMIEKYVGSEVFRRSLNAYLKKHAKHNASNSALFEEIDRSLHHDEPVVTDIMNTYIKQRGYPVLTLAWKGDLENVDHYYLYQSLFTYNNRYYLDEYDSIRWTIPITYKINTTGEPVKVIFPYNQRNITVIIPCNSMIKFNLNQTGLYHVNYGQAPLWQALIDNYKSFPIADRADIIQEIFTAATADYLDYSYLLCLLKELSGETDYVPLATVRIYLEELFTMLQLEGRLIIKKIMRKTIKQAYDKYGWKEITETDQLKLLTQYEILRIANMVDLEECRKRTNAEFKELTDNPKGSVAVSRAWRGIVYTYGGKNATDSQWNIIFDRFLMVSDPVVRMEMVMALASVSRAPLLSKLIYTVHNDDRYGHEEYYTVLKHISANPVGNLLIWDHVREHWMDIVDRFALKRIYLGKLIHKITSRFSSQLKIEEMKVFFKQYPQINEAVREEVLDRVNFNMQWVQTCKIVAEDILTKKIDLDYKK